MELLRAVAVKALVLKGRYDIGCMMRNAKHAKEVNEKLLRQILRVNRNSEYGKKYGFKDIHSVEEFKKKVPIARYDDLWRQA